MVNVNELCVTFDGWTDRCMARDYIRSGIIFAGLAIQRNDTIMSRSSISHITDNADHVNLLLKGFFPDPKKL